MPVLRAHVEPPSEAGDGAAAVDRAPTATPFPVGRVAAHALNVRECAGMDCPVVDWLVDGQVVTILEAAGDWFKIRLDDGGEGWVYSKYLEVEK